MKNLTHATLLCTLAFVTPLFAADESESLSLGCDSKKAVVLAAVEGGIAGLGAFVGYHMLTNNFKFPKLSEHPRALAIFTAAGTLAAGFWKYQYTPERHFDFARKEIIRISQNELFGLLVATDADKLIDILKDRYFREKLPLYTAFKQIDKICAVVDQCKESLNEVLGSSRSDLYPEAMELQVVADMYLVILKDVFKQLKDDPNFISECNAGTLELMKEAQEAAASAAQSSAFAQHVSMMSASKCNHIHVSNVPATNSVSAQVSV